MTHTTSHHSNAESDIQIYVACLAAYNNAQLHGRWIDATQPVEDIIEEVQAMLKESPQPAAEEFAIHDYEGFCGIKLSEWEGFEEVHAIASFIEEHGKLGAELIRYCDDIKSAKTMMVDHYAGCYSCAADFAQELTESTTEIPQHLAYYIDYDRMAKDMEMSGDTLIIEMGMEQVHVFWVY